VLISHHRIDVGIRLEAVSESLLLSMAEPSLTVSGPGTTTIEPQDITLSVADAAVADVSTSLTASEALTLSMGEPSVGVSAPGQTTYDVPDMTLSVSDQANVTVSTVVEVEDPLALTMAEPSLNVSAPGQTTYDVPDIQLGVSDATSVTVRTALGASEDITLGMSEPSLSTTAPGQTTYDVPNMAISASDSVAINEASPPTAALSASATFGTGAQFDASGSTDPDGDTLEFRFDPGDGSGYTPWQDSSFESHTYPSSGTYTATVQVREKNTADQLTDSASDSVTV